MSIRFHIHPLFVVTVVQMLRHDERRQAARLVHAELRAALTARRATGAADDDDSGGPIFVPSLEQRTKLGYADIALISETSTTQEYPDESIDLSPP